MATTYKKTLKTITVKTVGGQTITAADTTSATPATNALAAFDSYETMNLSGTLVPFHAVDSVVVTAEQSENIERPDAYCPED